MKKISILVPCYNVANYIDYCLKSLTTITLEKKNYLIICYNDGSQDETLQYLRRWEKQYACIKVISNNQNFGISYARQQLLKEVKTEYFYFVDADDFVLENGLTDMYALARETNADMVFAKSWIYTNKCNAKAKMNWFTNHLSKKTTIMKYIDNNLLYLWNVLIKYKFFKQINFIYSQHTSCAEDHLLMSVMLSYNPQVAFLPTPTYYYRRNIQSQMNKQDATFKRMSDNFINFMQIHNQTKKNLQIHPEICQTVLSNALYIVLMNIGMVFSWTCRGKKIRKNLNMKEKSKCEKFIENIKGVLKLTNSKIVLPNSWWKKLSAFVYIHKVFTRIKNKNIGYLTH